MKVVEQKIYVADDGREFSTFEQCRAYEEYLYPIIKPEWIEAHNKQVAENEQVKSILLANMEQHRMYILTDLYFELLPQFDFLRKRMTVQRLTALMRQLVCDSLIEKVKRGTKAYFIKM